VETGSYAVLDEPGTALFSLRQSVRAENVRADL